jgi:hypothetical protein
MDLYKQTLESQRRVRGARHQDTLVTQINLTVLLAQENKKREAEALHSATLKSYQLPASNGPNTPFDGEWRGRWENNRGEKGEERLSIKETTDGAITGVYAWSNISIPVRGDRLGRTTFVIKGATKSRFYRIVGTVDDGKVLLRYSASRLNTSGSYWGWSTLTKSTLLGR